MKTKIVYVLVSCEDDYYYEMFLLSYHSLRLHHSKEETEVCLVMDNETDKRLIDKGAAFLDSVTPITIDIPEKYSVMQRSRYLKTSLRTIINGDFLYLDTDTIICDRLDEIDRLDGEICAVVDNHGGGCIDVQVDATPEELGWKNLVGTKHYNGGVLYAKDTTNVSLFFEQWHRYWEHGASFNINYDQLSLRKTNLESSLKISELDGVWNCQVLRESSSPFRKDAKILHFQCSPMCWYDSYNETTFLKIRLAGRIPDDLVEKMESQYFKSSTRQILLPQHDYLMLSPMFATYKDYPRLYSVLVTVSNAVRSVIVKLYRLKQFLYKRIK